MAKASSGGERNLAVDALKLALAVMVVGIHADPFAGLGRPLHLLTAEGLFRLGVPIFLIFNGYYLQAAIAAGRGGAFVLRALRLYALWMVLYLPISWPLLTGLTGPELLRLLVFGYWHLWYLSGLAMAGAVLLLIAPWYSARLWAVAGLCWGLGSLLTWGMALDLVHPGQPFSDPLLIQRNALVLSLPCLIVGFLIRRQDLVTRLPRGTAKGLALIGLAAVAGETLLLGIMPKGTAHDLMPSLGLAAPALALVALQSHRMIRGRQLSDLSSGVYFLHVAFVALSFRYTDLPSPVVFALAVAGSLALTLILSRAGLARRLF